MEGPCGVCGQPSSYKCSGCGGKQVYCSKTCQKKAWEAHYYDCKAQPSYSTLRQDRPALTSGEQFKDLIDEIKTTYYSEGGSTWITIKSANESKKIEKYNEDELNRHMILFTPKKREKIKKIMITAIVGKEEADNQGSVGIGSELASNVTRAYRKTFLPKYQKATNTRYKFDLLYGFTGAIYEYWFWMQRHPYDWDGHKMLTDLGKKWKELLSTEANGPEQLGLDPIFSYPAIWEFLRKFKVDLEEESCACPQEGLHFNYE